MAKRIIDLTGQKFTRLTVIRHAGKNPWGQNKWECLCDCGKTTYAITGQLRNGMKKSCGCIVSENAVARNTTHGLTNDPAWVAFHQAKQRCYNPRFVGAEYYSEKRICMCAGWVDNCAAFCKAVGPRPSPELSIDRINNNGNYSCGECPECIANGWPVNVHWATKTEQSQNRSNTVWLTHNNETHCLSEWARITGISHTTISDRLKAGRTVEESLTVRPARRNKWPTS